MIELMVTKSWNGLRFGVSKRFVTDKLGKDTFSLEKVLGTQTVVQMNFGSLECIFVQDQLWAISVDFAWWSGLPPDFEVEEWLLKPFTARRLLANFRKRGIVLRKNRKWSDPGKPVYDHATWCHIYCDDRGNGRLVLSKVDSHCHDILKGAGD